MEDLCKQQLEANVKLNQLLANLRKTPTARRSTDYLEQKAIEFEINWKQIEANQAKINILAPKNKTHEYFTENQFGTITKSAQLFTDCLEKMRKDVNQTSVGMTEMLYQLINNLQIDINSAVSRNLSPNQCKLRAKLFEARLTHIQDEQINDVKSLSNLSQFDNGKFITAMEMLMDGIS